ncbi:MAG: hypothetical protein AAF197_12235 [Pseudomonadota bacterium]
MTEFNSQTPKLALWLIDKCLPESIKDDVAGDLTEEFNQANKAKFERYSHLWQQTLGACWRYAPRNKPFVQSFGLALFTVLISFVLIRAVMFLSFADDFTVYAKEYWTNGSVHLSFVEPLFWKTMVGDNAYPFELWALIDGWSYTWSISCLFAISLLSRKVSIGVTGYSIFTLIACVLPYLFGIYSFQYVGLGLKEAGPMIAFMWIPTLYILLPMSVVIMRKFYQQRFAVPE